MGQWNRRWISRKKYNYQDPPPSPPEHLQFESDSAGGICNNSVPVWERNFCISMGIPWKKVVVAKRYMYCHDKVLKWNDSAGADAFHVAKRLFWSKVNGHPSDAVLPDPDMYIDYIDWNSNIDPELVLDLDRECFIPDDLKQDSRKEEVHNSVISHVLEWDGKKPSSDRSPLVCTIASKDVIQGRNQWENSINLEKDVENPWERSCPKVDEALKDSAWDSPGDESWGWKQGLNDIKESRYLGSHCVSGWDRGCPDVGYGLEKGWTGGGNNAWSLYSSKNESRKSYNCEIPWRNNFVQSRGASHQRGRNFVLSIGVSNQRGWKDSGENSWGCKRWENQNYESRNYDFRWPIEGGRALNSGYRKREGSQRHTARYKSLRFHGESDGTTRHWRKRNS